MSHESSASAAVELAQVADTAPRRMPALVDRPLRYAAAALVAAGAVALTQLAGDSLGNSVFLLLFPAVALAAWLGGLGPALVASLVAVVGANIWLMEPRGRLALHPTDLIRLVTFFTVSLLVSYLTVTERKARRAATEHAGRAERLAQDLQHETIELEQQVEESQQLQEELEQQVEESQQLQEELEQQVEESQQLQQALAEQQAMLLEARDLLLRETARLRLVGDASRIFASSLDYQATLRSVAQAFVPALADASAMDIVLDPSAREWPPRVQRLAIVHRDPARVERARELLRGLPLDWSTEHGLAHVLRTGEAEFRPEVTDAYLRAVAHDDAELELLRQLGLASLLMVPIRSGDALLGAITLAMTDSGRAYNDSDLRLAQDVAARAAVAIEHARLFRDVQRARAEAEEANRAKTEFLAVVSHELRTPLNAVAGYAQLLELGIRGDINDRQREDLQRIQRSSRHLLALINQILSFAKIEAGQVQPEPAVVAASDALADLEALVGPQAITKGIAFVHREPPRAIHLWCDPEKLQQILLNLVSNAVKFTPAGGTITVWTEVDAETAALLVQDTGGGIPPEKLDRVFEPFVQLDRGLTSTKEGTGLGLAISRELARAMGGDLRAEPLEGGARFRLTMPLARPDPHAPANPALAGTQPGTPTSSAAIPTSAEAPAMADPAYIARRATPEADDPLRAPPRRPAADPGADRSRRSAGRPDRPDRAD